MENKRAQLGWLKGMQRAGRGYPSNQQPGPRQPSLVCQHQWRRRASDRTAQGGGLWPGRGLRR